MKVEGTCRGKVGVLPKMDHEFQRIPWKFLENVERWVRTKQGWCKTMYGSDCAS